MWALALPAARMPAPAPLLRRHIQQRCAAGLAVGLPSSSGKPPALPASQFAPQVAIEVGIGVCTKTTAEYTKRGDDFKSQLDFVFANLVM